MEPLGIHGVFVEASASTFNPLHNGDDEGAHSVPESSFGAPSEKGRVVLTNTRALQGDGLGLMGACACGQCIGALEGVMIRPKTYGGEEAHRIVSV